MAEIAPLFDLVLTGQLAQGVVRADAQAQLALLFKMPVEKVAGLLNNAPITLKKDLAWDVAKRYRVAIKQAGALSDIRPAEQRKSQSTSDVSSASDFPSTRDVTSTAVTQTALAVEEIATGQLPAETEIKTPTEIPAWDLAEVGADVLRPAERQTVVSRLDDFNDFSLRPNQGNLLDDTEYAPELATLDDLGESLELLPSGSEVLAEHERALPVAALVDAPDLDVANLGERLSIARTENHPAPDVSHLVLADK